ncbi:MAG TPA: phospho-sugar mutase, partial [Chitinophagaceae bacterium]
MDARIEEKVNSWLTGTYDEDVKSQIRRMQEADGEELADAFYKNLEFGTGGLRGIMGIGSNRINKYTVAMATQGYANYLIQCFPAEQVKVAI